MCSIMIKIDFSLLYFKERWNLCFSFLWVHLMNSTKWETLHYQGRLWVWKVLLILSMSLHAWYYLLIGAMPSRKICDYIRTVMFWFSEKKQNFSYFFIYILFSSAVKMVNQLLAGVHIAASAEAMAIGARLGLNTRKLFDFITNSGGTSWYV